MIFVILVLFFLCCITGTIFFWKKRKILSFLFFLPLFLLTLLGGTVFYQLRWHITTPESLDFTVQNQKNQYVVTGKWNDSLDSYLYPSDFLILYVPNNTKINVERQSEVDVTKADPNAVKILLPNEKDKTLEPQILDIQTTKQFVFSFNLPDNINPKDVKIYYAHMREEPMSSPTAWFKEINLVN